MIPQQCPDGPIWVVVCLVIEYVERVGSDQKMVDTPDDARHHGRV